MVLSIIAPHTLALVVVLCARRARQTLGVQTMCGTDPPAPVRLRAGGPVSVPYTQPNRSRTGRRTVARVPVVLKAQLQCKFGLADRARLPARFRNPRSELGIKSSQTSYAGSIPVARSKYRLVRHYCPSSHMRSQAETSENRSISGISGCCSGMERIPELRLWWGHPQRARCRAWVWRAPPSARAASRGGCPSTADVKWKGSTHPFHSQSIAHRGACGKAPVMSQNRRP